LLSLEAGPVAAVPPLCPWGVLWPPVTSPVGVALAPWPCLRTGQAPPRGSAPSPPPAPFGPACTVTPAGKVRPWLSTTPDASDGPALATVTVYARLPAPEPAITASADSVVVTTRSTSRTTVVLSLSPSSPVLMRVSLQAVTVA